LCIDLCGVAETEESRCPALVAEDIGGSDIAVDKSFPVNLSKGGCDRDRYIEKVDDAPLPGFIALDARSTRVFK
jgi:hypothetical protein